MSEALYVRPHVRQITISRKSLFLIVLLALIWSPVLVLRGNYLLVALPPITIISIAAIFLVTLWRWSGTLPVFEIGAIFGAVSMLYGAVPALNFMSAGLSWTLLSDGRLQYYNPSPLEVARFTWPYAGFLAGFAIAYAVVRGRRLPRMRHVMPLDKSSIIIAVSLFVAIEGGLYALQRVIDINFDPSYLHGGLEAFSAYYELPYVLQQVFHNLVGWRFAIKLVIAAILLIRWRTSPSARWLLLAFLIFDTVTTSLNLGSRTYNALLVLSAVFLYHRFVKPLSLRVAVTGALCIIVGYTLIGTIRTIGSFQGAVQLDNRLWTTNNDFQTMFASGYSVQHDLETGAIGQPPWEAHFIDLVLLIPSQLLPFKKVDPSAWYYGQIGASASMMFGLRAQPVIGFGWPEFALRGMFLGVLFAALHRWYVKRRSSSFWMTLLYLYACIWSHYVFRSTMLWPTYFLVYEFIPIMFLVRGGAFLIRTIPEKISTVAFR